MPDISKDIIQHHLNVNPERKPIQQRRRVFTFERNRAIMDELEKLLAANFIQEVYYLKWLANIVKWRMYVDFTDLNVVCPKDSFPLSTIDQLVDLTVGHKLLMFMDVFLGYNLIQMLEEDQEKTTFITSQRLYCYRAMPFRLKDEGATYQRLVN